MRLYKKPYSLKHKILGHSHNNSHFYNKRNYVKRFLHYYIRSSLLVKQNISNNHYNINYHGCFFTTEQRSNNKNVNVTDKRKEISEFLKSQSILRRFNIKKFLLGIPSKTSEIGKNTIRILTSRELFIKKLIQIRKSLKNTIVHFYHGSRLLFSNVKNASGLTLLVIKGHPLSRREKKQLIRTYTDVLLFVPMVIILIIPFLEFFLPFLIAIFPNMLPSTFKDKFKEKEKHKKQLNKRLELAEIYQDAMDNVANKLFKKYKGPKQLAAQRMQTLLKDVRNGKHIDNNSLLDIAELFEDDITLDSFRIDKLKLLCRYMGLRPYGSETWLRKHLLWEFKRIKKDDLVINAEGIDSLSSSEIEEACRERGMRVLNLHESQIRKNLAQWLDLSLNHSLPISLLVFSRTFTMSQKYKELKETDTELIAKAVTKLSDDCVDEVLVDKLGIDDSDKKRDILEHQNKLIEKERNDENNEEVKEEKKE